MENNAEGKLPSPARKGAPLKNMEDAESARRVRSRDLFGFSRRLIIDHDGREYCLLITRQGKLILNRGS